MPAGTGRPEKDGVHYTPVELAGLLAAVALEHLVVPEAGLRVLDPACGDGVLLEAVADRLVPDVRRRTVFTGREVSAEALGACGERLSGIGVNFVAEGGDFLESATPGGLFDDRADAYDLVIANPPYVRTQDLGAVRSRTLAKAFGLTGRVDLYQAFAAASYGVLKPGGVFALLTSNSFMTTRAGASLRKLLVGEFEVKHVIDLGDTKPFKAAVLPAIVVAVKRKSVGSYEPARFDRVYGADGADAVRSERSVLAAIADPSVEGVVEAGGKNYRLERGVLPTGDSGDVWRMSTKRGEKWLGRIAATRAGVFGDFGKVRVGIKSTADKVFVRNDWHLLPQEAAPEDRLLRPLITHRNAARWRATERAADDLRVLYPYEPGAKRRKAVSLEDHPGAAAYLADHEDRLRRRSYVLAAGREWYELWVPHRPADWAKPKLVWPDIAEEPRFSLDESGAVVQGDCYWLIPNEGVDPDWLMLMLAVGNSSLATRFYDTVFHNKLYAGRRRFMTQYVKEFPLPPLRTPHSIRAVKAVRRLLADPDDAGAEEESNRQIWKSFGFGEPFAR